MVVSARGNLRMEGIKATLSIDFKEAFNAELQQMILRGRESCAVEVTIKELGESATDKQVSAYHGPILNTFVNVYRESGYRNANRNNVDELLRTEYLSDSVTAFNGKLIHKVLEIKDCNKARLSEFIDTLLQELVQNHGINLELKR